MRLWLLRLRARLGYELTDRLCPNRVHGLRCPAGPLLDRFARRMMATERLRDRRARRRRASLQFMANQGSPW